MRIAIIALFMATVLFSCDEQGSGKKAPIKTKPKAPTFNKETELTLINSNGDSLLLDIELAQTAQEVQRGLMYRSFMPQNAGMLFIMPREEQQSFWMKNTQISLDIIYISSAGKIVSIQEKTPVYNTDALPSEGAAKYVLEVNAGFCERNTIKAGNTVLLPSVIFS